VRNVRELRNAAAEWLESGGRWRWLLAVLLLCWIVPRVLYLDADPPSRLPNEINSALDFIVEPPAKSHEARNFALFGRWKTNPADEYQFWRMQSPVWVYSLAYVYKVFGVRYVVLRGFCVAVAGIGFVVALALARRRHDWLTIFAVFPLWAFNFYCVAWDRSGLIEVMISTWILVMVYCLDRAEEHPLWLVGSQVAFALAFFSKQGAIYGFPLMVGANLFFWIRERDAAAYRGFLKWLPIVSAMVVAGVALALIFQPDYQRALTWNYDHMLFSDENDYQGRSLRTIAVRLQDIDRYYTGYLGLFPIAGVLAAVGATHTVLEGVGRKRWDRHATLITAWMLVAWVTLTLSRQTEVRFYAVLAAPVALLACEGARVIYRWAAGLPRPWLGHVLVGGALLTGSSLQINWLGIWFRQPTYQIRDLNRLVADRIGDQEAVVVGRYAVPMTLETPYEVYYVKFGFNMEPEVIEALAPTHGLWQEHRELSKPYLNRFGQQSRNFEVLAVTQLFDEEITLFEWNEPLVAPSHRADAAARADDHAGEDEDEDDDQVGDRRKVPTRDRRSNGQDIDLRN